MAWRGINGSVNSCRIRSKKGARIAQAQFTYPLPPVALIHSLPPRPISTLSPHFSPLLLTNLHQQAEEKCCWSGQEGAGLPSGASLQQFAKWGTVRTFFVTDNDGEHWIGLQIYWVFRHDMTRIQKAEIFLQRLCSLLVHKVWVQLVTDKTSISARVTHVQHIIHTIFNTHDLCCWEMYWCLCITTWLYHLDGNL